MTCQSCVGEGQLDCRLLRRRGEVVLALQGECTNPTKRHVGNGHVRVKLGQSGRMFVKAMEKRSVHAEKAKESLLSEESFEWTG